MTVPSLSRNAGFGATYDPRARGAAFERTMSTNCGILKLNKRVVVCDSSRIDTLLALPL